MIPFKQFGAKNAAKIRYVLCDIDDTITTDGKLSATAYTALWQLYEAGIHVIPVTGRPAGWCDLIVREWPVRAVVGENGAFVYYFEGKHLRSFLHPSIADADARARLHPILETCMREVPGCRAAKDQFARIYDLAIDFREDPPYLGFEEANKICAICRSMGAQAKVSSIHVNTWFGDYDKLTMTRLFLREVLGENDPRACTLFFGDSPNDEPMFAYFPLCCAVANIKPFVEQLAHLPAYVAEKESGAGFAEAIGQLLAMR